MLVEDVEMWMTGPYLHNMADLVILGDEARWSQELSHTWQSILLTHLWSAHGLLLWGYLLCCRT